MRLALDIPEMQFIREDCEIQEHSGVTTFTITMIVPTQIWREARGRQGKRKPRKEGR